MRKSRKQTSSASNVAYVKLRDLITYGNLSPGEKIVESRLEKRFAISRTPIREAIKQLEKRGYVEIVHNRGAFVKKVSLDELEKTYDVLSVLESYAAKLAAGKVNDQAIRKLTEINEELKELGHLSKYRKYLEGNSEFHRILCEISGNNVLQNLSSELRDRVYRYRFLGITIPGHIKEYIAEHEVIIRGLKDRDAEKVGDTVWQRIQRTKETVGEFLREL